MNHDVFAAIADSNRRKIIELLAVSSMTVNTIAGHFSVSRPAISKHLKILLQAKLVAERKAGRQRFYHLQAGQLKVVYDWLGHYEKFWKNKLNNLGDYLEGNE